MGTSTGKIVSYNLGSGAIEGNELKAAGSTQAITMIKRFVGIEDQGVYLCTVDKKELLIFEEKKKSTKLIDFGEEGNTYAGNEICNI